MKYQTKLIKTISFYLMIILSFQQLGAQVTIGYANEPHAGALLDLSGGQGSPDFVVSKGLGLPRVALEEIRQLFPMFRGNIGYENGTTKKDIDREHIGLMVYNTNLCIDSNDEYPRGMYVWDGAVWKRLSQLESGNGMIYKDQDGKDFKAQLFGDAGIWMVENLSVTKYAPGEGGAALPTSPSNASSSDSPSWCYPGTNNLDPTLFEMQPSLGLLYNWPAATNKKISSGIDESGTNEGARVQGICPDGWHLPSDKEWTDLENEIIKNTSKYSTMEDIIGPLLAYDRPSGATTSPHGKAMKAQCMIAGSTALPNAYGASLPASGGGFCAYLGGFSPSSQFYGLSSYFWTSSASDAAIGAWNRRINAVKDYPANNLNPETVMSRNSMGRQFLTAIRCKKDNDIR